MLKPFLFLKGFNKLTLWHAACHDSLLIWFHLIANYGYYTSFSGRHFNNLGFWPQQHICSSSIFTVNVTVTLLLYLPFKSLCQSMMETMITQKDLFLSNYLSQSTIFLFLFINNSTCTISHRYCIAQRWFIVLACALQHWIVLLHK